MAYNPVTTNKENKLSRKERRNLLKHIKNIDNKYQSTF
jgi:hypothetical protein